MSHYGKDLLGGPPPTLLPDEAGPRELLAGGTPAAEVAARHPTSSAAWAVLATSSLSEGAGGADVARQVASYAYARTGYHRGLDALRRNGWKGYGPVPWAHAPNQGFLRSLHALGRAASAIGEEEEAQRIDAFLDDCDPAVKAELGPLTA